MLTGFDHCAPPASSTVHVAVAFPMYPAAVLHVAVHVLLMLAPLQACGQDLAPVPAAVGTPGHRTALQDPTGAAHPRSVQRAVTVVPAKPAAVLQIPMHVSPIAGAVHCCSASHLA
jgi:hypothetical protein